MVRELVPWFHANWWALTLDAGALWWLFTPHGCGPRSLQFADGVTLGELGRVFR